MENLPLKIKLLRVRHSLSQCEFAEKIGASTTSICAWERGKWEISMSSLRAICKAFSLEMSYFFEEITP